MAPAEIIAVAQAWLFWDKVRFLGILLVFITTVLALTTPPLRTQDAIDNPTG